MDVTPDFWLGLITGLLGAVVGGVFTAWSTRSQMRSAFRLAKMQIEAGFEQQAEQHRLEVERQSTLEVCRGIARLCHKAEVVGEEHHFAHESDGDKSECRVSAELIEELRQWRYQLDDMQILYSAHYTEEVGNIYERLFKHVPFGDERERYNKRYASWPSDTECRVGNWAEAFSDTARQAIKEIYYVTGLSAEVPFHLTLDELREGVRRIASEPGSTSAPKKNGE